mgnify:CR=1 FL=1
MILPVHQIVTSTIAAFTVSATCVASALFLVSFNSEGSTDNVKAYIVNNEVNSFPDIKITSVGEWPSSKETTHVDAVSPGEQKNTTTPEEEPTLPETNVDNTENPVAPHTLDNSLPAPLPSERDSTPNNQTLPRSPQESSVSQETGYDYLLNVPGYCGGGWECAQEAVNSTTLSYVYYSPNFSIIAGHNYGPAGVIANFTPGTIVKVTGNGAGLYRITRTHWMSYSTDVQKVYGQFAFQTCVGSQILHAYAERIG